MEEYLSRRRILAGSSSIALSAMLCGRISRADAAWASFTASSGFNWASIDGSPNAPAGPAQYPNLFTSATGGPRTSSNNTNAPYAVRPAWHVAGVDYAVGIPNTVTLLDPGVILSSTSSTAGSTLSTNAATTSGNVLSFASTTGALVGMTVSGTNIPANTVVQAMNATSITLNNNVSGTVASAATITFGGVQVTNSGLVSAGNPFLLQPTVNGIVFDSLDLTKSGGWQIKITNASNTTIIRCNCNSTTTAQSDTINFQGLANGNTGVGLTVQYCQIDGTYTKECINLSSGGPFVIQYNWIKNGQENLISAGAYGRSGTSYDIRFNIFENDGTTSNASAHCDIIQTYPSGDTNAVVTFTNGSSNIGWTANGLLLNDQICFPSGAATGSLPTGFALDTVYYVVTTGTNTIQVSATQGGAAIVAGSAATGTQYGACWFPYSIVFNFNTVIQVWSNLIAGSVGLTFDGNDHFGSTYGMPAIFSDIEVNYCTMINNGGPQNAMGQLVKISKSVTNVCNVTNNYVDPTAGNTGFVLASGGPSSGNPPSPYGGSPNWQSNLNMITAATILTPF